MKKSSVRCLKNKIVGMTIYRKSEIKKLKIMDI